MFLFLVITFKFLEYGATEPPIDGKIVGGTAISIETAPYQVSLHLYNKFRCGGSIITPQHVLTAAHCTYLTRANRLSVRVGSNKPNKGGQKITIERYFQHKRYRRFSSDFDISVLKLKNDIKLGATARIVPLPSQSFREPTNQLATVTGWGAKVEGGSAPSEDLHLVLVTVVNRDECKKKYEDFVKQRMICAYYAGSDACQGDSGGPLVYNNVQIGIVSTGKGCARPDYPGVYTDVAKYADFITKMIKK